MNKAIFIDRDGVICEEKNLFYKGYRIVKPEHFEWVMNSKKAIEVLSKLKDFKLILISNQSGINRNLITIEDFHKINQPLYNELEKNRLVFNGIYICPHLSSENCNCRKPKTGMILQAKEDLDIDFEKSYIIGDQTSDIKMGKDVGCKTILVKTGYGGVDNSFNVNPDFIVENLLEAVGKIS